MVVSKYKTNKDFIKIKDFILIKSLFYILKQPRCLSLEFVLYYIICLNDETYLKLF